MYVRVLRAQFHVEKIAQAEQLYWKSLIPAAKQQKGFRNAYLAVDRATGTGISLTFWETEADLTASETNGYFQEQLAKFAPVFAAPPTREAYEVIAQE